MRAALTQDPVESAQAAGLKYVSDSRPGIRRKGSGSGFTYLESAGSRITDPATLRRIRSLAIPPAWRDVWICPWPNGHLQATGRDSRGRKQYRYHPRWRTVRDETKFTRMIAFGQALPQIRRRVEQDLASPGLNRSRVLATVVRLLEATLIRVGNEEYARENNSFGLTTLKDQHVKITGSTLRFRFRGKGGKLHEIDIHDPRLARIVKQCRDIPGYELFQYYDDNGEPQTIDSTDVNAYLKEISGEEFTAKDFRTWAATVFAAMALSEFEKFDSNAMAKGNVVRAIENVAKRLGNTATICRKCYIHPAVIDGYMDGTMLEALKKKTESLLANKLEGLDPEEAAVLAFLQKRLESEALTESLAS